MNDALGWFLAGMAGIALGAFFFGGLWWTVDASVSSRRPGLLVFVSLITRMGITLAGFYWVAGISWQALLACLGGFVLARFVIIGLLAPRLEGNQLATRDSQVTHAP